MTSYLLPLEVLVSMMKDLPEQVLLQAPLSSVPGLSKEPCTASVVVGTGGMHSCMLQDAKTGQVLKKGPEAMRVLQACGELSWRIQPRERSHLPEQLARTFNKEIGSLPHRVVAVTATQMHRLSHASKQVLSLVNGTNSLERIAHLLNKSPQDVHQILLELQQQGLIRL